MAWRVVCCAIHANRSVSLANGGSISSSMSWSVAPERSTTAATTRLTGNGEGRFRLVTDGVVTTAVAIGDSCSEWVMASPWDRICPARMEAQSCCATGTASPRTEFSASQHAMAC